IVRPFVCGGAEWWLVVAAVCDLCLGLEFFIVWIGSILLDLCPMVLLLLSILFSLGKGLTGF
ncbi:hypothetical protein BD770DRAFT_390801, partial [Pilaira anomala]